jgi:hypothetical protein
MQTTTKGFIVIQINGLNKSLFGGGHTVNILNGYKLPTRNNKVDAIKDVYRVSASKERFVKSVDLNHNRILDSYLKKYEYTLCSYYPQKF